MITWNTEHNIMGVYHSIFNWYTMKLAKKNPMILPALDFDDHIPTSYPYDLTLKWWLKIVKDKGKDANWLKPNRAILISKKRCPPNEDILEIFSSILNATKGTIPKANAVGMAVLRQTRVCLLSLTIEYLQNVPTDNDKNITASMIPKNNSPIPNWVFILCLLKEYVILSICTLA